MGCTESSAIHPSEVGKKTAGSARASGAAKSLNPQHLTEKIVLGRYAMALGADTILGVGSSSMCRRGTDTETAQAVAIKVYKEEVSGNEASKGLSSGHACDTKFDWQITVLMELAKPFNLDQTASPGRARILGTNPATMFVRLFDFSPSECLERYIVTEVAHLSLKSMLQKRLLAKKGLNKDKVRHISQAIVLAAGGLHEKGLVHLDIKPENVMRFGDFWKLIDFDGCMCIGSEVPYTGSSFTFSPCYCAPEMAYFVMSGDATTAITINASIDSWSVGMTLAELVCLEAPLQPMFAKVVRETGVQDRQSVMSKFLNNLTYMQEVPVPRCLDKFHVDFARMIKFGLLEMCPRNRLTMAGCLEDEFMQPFEYKSSVCKTSFTGMFARRKKGEVQRQYLPETTTK